MRPDTNGGFWFFYGNAGPTIQMVHWRAGVGWAERDTIGANYPLTSYQATKTVDATQDGRPRPVLAWSTMSGDGVERVYAAWPTDSGWARGEQVPGTDDAGIPVVARDVNGDVWVAWAGNFDGIFWSHTYTSAFADTPSVGQSGTRPLVRWNLDRPAPESAWTLWRSAGGDAFVQVARVQAGGGTVMSAVDSTAPDAEVLHYRVQRECKDTRYVWTSAEAVWLPHSVHLAVALRSGNPAHDAIDVDVLGANAGGMTLELYDLQGRVVARARGNALGSGRDGLRLGLDPALHPGLYLLRARTADQRLSRGLKIAVVR